MIDLIKYDKRKQLGMLVACCYLSPIQVLGEAFDEEFDDELTELNASIFKTEGLGMEGLLIHILNAWGFEDMDRCGDRWVRALWSEDGGLLHKHLKSGPWHLESHNTSTTLWQEVRTEMHLLICTKNRKYSKLRKQLAMLAGNKAQLAYVSALAAAIAPYVGVTLASILTPLCAICVLVPLNVGREVACSKLSKQGEVGISLWKASGENARSSKFNTTPST